MFNVFPSVKGRDFRPPEADVPARDEDIDSGVDVPVMPSTTSTTDPVPYYEAFSTFWAAACTARGTDLHGQMLINLEVFSPVPHGLVVERPRKITASPSMRIARAAWNGIHPKDFLPRHRGRLP